MEIFAYYYSFVLLLYMAYNSFCCHHNLPDPVIIPYIHYVLCHTQHYTYTSDGCSHRFPLDSQHYTYISDGCSHRFPLDSQHYTYTSDGCSHRFPLDSALYLHI